jgi:hypothetical protein
MDWIGNNKNAFACNGASNHSLKDRETNDFYATDPKAVEMLLKLEKFNKTIWEPACGKGHVCEVLKKYGYNVIASDIVDWGYPGTLSIDFLKDKHQGFFGDIITNPPYKYAKEFVEKALSSVQEGNKIAMFLKLTFLESKKRRKLFAEHPPKVVYISSSRLQCARNGDFEKFKNGIDMAIAYAWFIWEKGFKGNPIIRWFN